MAPTSFPSTPPTDPQFSAQLQRIDALHQKLKAEAARSQDFLAKLKRGEEAQTQTQNLTEMKSRPAVEDDNFHQRMPSRNGESSGKDAKASNVHMKNGNPSSKEPVCCCQHHQSKPLTEKEKKLAEEYRKKMPPLGSNFPPLPTHVDEREVRDLEKRVRGLEGRVRGFEGLPPDREMALLEVERLRRELEGLARRREGLFGLMDEKSKAEVVKTKTEGLKVIGKPNGKVAGKGSVTVGGKANGKIDAKDTKKG